MHIFLLLQLRLECMQENRFDAHTHAHINRLHKSVYNQSHSKATACTNISLRQAYPKKPGSKNRLICVKSGSHWQLFVSSWTSEGQTDDYGRVRGVIEATKSNCALYWTGLIRVSHAAQISSPWHNIIWWKLSSVMKRWGREGPINTWFEKNRRFRHMSGPSQKRARRHTEIYPRKKKLTQMEGQADTQSVSHRGASRLLCHSVGTNQNPLD